MQNLLRISEAASLAMHVMSLLARHQPRRFANQELADYLQASGHTLAKVMQRMVRAGLVDSQRGPTGGFVLSKPPADISVLEIYQAIDGPIGAAGCLLGKRPCVSESCMLGGLVCQIHQQVEATFGGTNLDVLAESMRLGDDNFKQDVSQGQG